MHCSTPSTSRGEDVDNQQLFGKFDSFERSLCQNSAPSWSSKHRGYCPHCQTEIITPSFRSRSYRLLLRRGESRKVSGVKAEENGRQLRESIGEIAYTPPDGNRRSRNRSDSEIETLRDYRLDRNHNERNSKVSLLSKLVRRDLLLPCRQHESWS